MTTCDACLNPACDGQTIDFEKVRAEEWSRALAEVTLRERVALRHRREARRRFMLRVVTFKRYPR